MSRILPRQPTPLLEVDTPAGAWRLADQRPAKFTMVVVYRGLHCPICRGYLKELEGKLDEFAQRGVTVIAISTDTADRAERTRREWALDRLTLGHGLSIGSARAWGLYISRAIKDTEPAEFAEPGLFLARPDGTLYFASIQTMPFARPAFDQILGAIEFVVARDYPARGES